MFKAIFEWISNIDSMTGIIAAVFSVAIFLKLRKQTKRIRALAKEPPVLEDFEKTVKYNKDVNTENPYALCICLLPYQDSIKGEVQLYLKALGKKYSNMEIMEVNIKGVFSQNLKDFIVALSVKRNELEAVQATEVHLFFAGPVFAATLVGAMFDNWRPVKIYQKNLDSKTYEYICPLLKNWM